jgi:hypothetical protein
VAVKAAVVDGAGGENESRKAERERFFDSKWARKPGFGVEKRGFQAVLFTEWY